MFKLIKQKTYTIRVYCTGRLPANDAKWNAERGCYEIGPLVCSRDAAQSTMNALVQTYYGRPRRPDEEEYQHFINCYIVEQMTTCSLETDSKGESILGPYRQDIGMMYFGDKWELELVDFDHGWAEFKVLNDTGLREKLQQLANRADYACLEWIVPTTTPTAETETPTSE